MNIFKIVRRLRIGWLYRNCIDIVTGVDPITDEDILGISTRRHRQKRIVIDEEAVRRSACLLENPDDIWNLPDATFSLVAAGRKIGVGMKLTDRAGFTRLYWFRLRDLSRVSRYSRISSLQLHPDTQYQGAKCGTYRNANLAIDK